MTAVVKDFVMVFKNFGDYIFDELARHMDHSLADHIKLIIEGKSNFANAPWTTTDTQTLANAKAYVFAMTIMKEFTQTLYPDQKFTLAEFVKGTLVGRLNAPTALPTPEKTLKIFDDLKDAVEKDLNFGLMNRTFGEKIIDFLKSFVNVLITIFTFGQKQDFFSTSTHHLEFISNTREKLHNIYDQLDAIAKTAPMQLAG